MARLLAASTGSRSRGPILDMTAGKNRVR